MRVTRLCVIPSSSWCYVSRTCRNICGVSRRPGAYSQPASEVVAHMEPVFLARIVIIGFPRNHRTLYDCLRGCKALGDCRERAGHTQRRLPAFVHAEKRDAVYAAIDQYGWDSNRHVVVAQEFEARVMEAVGTLPSRSVEVAASTCAFVLYRPP